MTATKRLTKELSELRKEENSEYKTIDVEEGNMLRWNILLSPENAPYNKGAFKIEIQFPPEYPFKPPKIHFQTRIYHPNIDEKGQICLPIISADHWKPATKTNQVLRSLMNLLSNPEPEHPLRANLAEEYTRDKKRFDKNAEDFTKKHAEKRPCC